MDEMTLREVSAATGLSEGTLRSYRFIAKNGGPHRGPRSDLNRTAVRYPRPEIEAWLARHEDDWLES